MEDDRVDFHDKIDFLEKKIEKLEKDIEGKDSLIVALSCMTTEGGEKIVVTAPGMKIFEDPYCPLGCVYVLPKKPYADKLRRHCGK